MRTLWPALLFGALALVFPVFYGPALVTDLMARNDPPRAVSGASIGKAQCRTFFFIISFCKVSVVRAGSSERAFHYALSGPVRQEKLAVVGSPASPDYLATSLGRNHLLNRALTFVAWMAILISLTIGGLRYHAYHRAKSAPSA